MPSEADFTEDQERVLVYLVGHTCMSAHTAKRYEAIVRDLGLKVADLDGTLHELLNRGAIGKTKKGEGSKTHYWADPSVLSYLKTRGLWAPGRIHHL